MRRSRVRDERGAVLVMAVLLMAVVLTFTAFAVDWGTQRVARRDMQSLADAAAMDLARVIKGRTADAVLNDPAWPRVKRQAIEQNAKTVGSSPVLTPVLGTVDLASGAFTPVSGGAFPTAVKVIAATSVGFAFVPGRGEAARSAIASGADPALCFSVSPTALTVDTSGSALGPLLDSILKVNLKVLNPSGLLDVRGIQVPLADIATELKVGTPQALLDLKHVSLQTFMLASATALSKNGHAAQAAALQAIGTQISDFYFDVDKILTLDTANAAGLTTGVNVFDVVTGAIFAANGLNSINVKGLAVSLAGIAVQDLDVTITEPPQIACGKAGVVAKSAQVKVRLKSGITASGAADVLLDLNLELARGEGKLSRITCGTPTTAVIRATSGAARVSGPSLPDHLALLSLKVLKWDDLPLGVLVKLALKPLLGTDVLVVKTQIGATAAGGGPKDLTFTAGAAGAAIPSQSVTGDSVLTVALKGTTVTLLNGSLLGSLLGVLLDPLLDAIVSGVVTPIVNGPVNSLLSNLLYPLLNLLGIKIAVADVTVHGNIDCSTVKLVG